MGNSIEMECKGLITDSSGKRIAFIGSRQAYVIELESERYLGNVPLENDTDQKIVFSPQADTCIVGSWSEGLFAWNYRLKRILWRRPLKGVVAVSPYDGQKFVKVKTDGSVLIDIADGRIHGSKQNFDIYRHPIRDVTASFNLRFRKVTIRDAESGASHTFHLECFSILGIAWSNNVLLYTTPDGCVDGISIRSGQCLFRVKRGDWFNIAEVAFCEGTGEFYGIATDWNSEPKLALLGIPESNGRVTPYGILPNEPHHCFAQGARVVVSSDGSVYDCRTALVTKRLQWSLLFNET